MFSKSLRMIKTDQNMLELWKIVCKIYNFKISVFAGFIAWNFIVWGDELRLLQDLQKITHRSENKSRFLRGFNKTHC